MFSFQGNPGNIVKSDALTLITCIMLFLFDIGFKRKNANILANATALTVRHE